MKFQAILSIAALGAASLFTACQSGGEANNDAGATPPADLPADAQTDASTTINPSAPPAPATAEPAQNTDGVWHYTCAKGCAGGAGTATACATCGATLVHNQVYHSNDNTFPAVSPTAASGQPTQAPAPKPEPPQNAAGVWHFTCSAGCAGGAGAAGSCAKCGKALAHNAAYHQ